MTDTERAAFVKRFNELVFDDDIQWPVQVGSVRAGMARGLTQTKQGAWVAVRPVHVSRSYLGIFLGYLATGTSSLTYHPPSEELRVSMMTNPCMFVPELQRVVWGYESWWTAIETPEQLRTITDTDIDNVWYVQALKALAEPLAAVADEREP